jgi:hypothetical protein
MFSSRPSEIPVVIGVTRRAITTELARGREGVATGKRGSCDGERGREKELHKGS